MTQQFTNFCCRSGGSNLNAGTLNGDDTEPGTSASFTYASGTWVAATGVFTVASGNPLSDGVAVGNWASVYADGSTVTAFIGRVTARNATTITIIVASGNGCAGTVPTDGTNTRTVKIGGAWAGPGGTSWFPINFAEGAAGNFSKKQFMKDSTGRLPRFNLKNDQTYSMTAIISIAQNNFTFCTLQGYTTTYGDLGKSTIDATGVPGSGSSFMKNANDSQIWFKDLIIQNYIIGGGTPATHNDVFGELGNGISGYWARCVFRNAWSIGLEGANFAVECEGYNVGLNASDVVYAIPGTASSLARGICLRCIAHDNVSAGTPVVGSGIGGFHNASGSYHCIADTCLGHGVDGIGPAIQCDCYNTGGAQVAENSITLEQGAGSAVNCGATHGTGAHTFGITEPIQNMYTCRYGTGSEVGAGGNTNGGVDSFTDVTGFTANFNPWFNQDNGDFRLRLTETRGSGRGVFTQTAAGYAGTVGYPDIGAADAPSITVVIHPGMNGGM